MKKLITAFILSAVLIVNSFAEYNFSFSGEGVITPIAFSDGDSSVSAATATFDNEAKPRISFTLHGYSEQKTIGINAVFYWDGGNPAIGENSNIWIKPLGFLENDAYIDILKITVGKFEENNFRGRIGAADFTSWILPDGSKDEDGIFSRFKSDLGAHIAIRPLTSLGLNIGELIIEGAIGSNYSGERAFKNIIGWTAADVYKAAQVGIGYQIPDIGLFRVQFIGNNREVYMTDYPYKGIDLQTRLSQGLLTNSDADVIETAFTYEGLKGLKLELGVKIPMRYTTDLPNYVYYHAVFSTNPPYQTGITAGAEEVEVQKPISVSVGGTYTQDALNTLLRADLSFGGKYVHDGVREITEGFAIGISGSVSYEVIHNVKAGLDFGYYMHGFDIIKVGNKIEKIGERTKDVETSERNDFGLAPWVSLNVGGGAVKVGVAVMLPSSKRYSYTIPVAQGDDGFRPVYSSNPVISIPIFFSYNF